jgi:small subunit ribosomal protein S5
MKETRKKIDEVPKGIAQHRSNLESWKPKTELGKLVKTSKITSIKEVIESGKRILEAEAVDNLIPNLETDLLNVGQAKGKFGGGKKSIWKQTQKKTKEGNKPKFATLVVVGNKDGYVGLGYGKSKETMPAREKALRKAKLNIIEVVRMSSSRKKEENTVFTIPATVKGRYGGAEIELIPAPRGTGLCVEDECKKLMEMSGIHDIYSKSRNSKTKYNLINACFDALKQLGKLKIQEKYASSTYVVRGSQNE